MLRRAANALGHATMWLLRPVGRAAMWLLRPVGRLIMLLLRPFGRAAMWLLGPVGRVAMRVLRPVGHGIMWAFLVARRFFAWPAVRLFVASVLAGLVLAVITGPGGSASAPTSGFTGSLAFPRVWWFIGVGIAIFVIRMVASSWGPAITRFLRACWLALTRFFGSARTRAPLEALLVAFGFADVTWIAPHDTWKGGFCIQLGCALLAMECVTSVRHRWTSRAARLVSYGFIAGYGAMAWIHGPLARYLNRIGAVPHNQALGKFLMIAALVLAILDLLVYVAGHVRSRIPQRRGRTTIALGATVLVAYGWLMWTGWVEWRASQPTTLAHWLATKHLLPHSTTGGLVVMAMGGSLLALAAVWVVLDLQRGKEPATALIAEPGAIRRVGTVPFGRPALTLAVFLLALEWPLHMDSASLSNIDSQIMPFVLLALGLNVVIGYAGLLDLGYVAFYAIGAYTTAYFTGALGPQPPFLLDTFWAVPLAIVAAMLAGVLLGFPTLRLRGDYLAIVTLGFGEFIFLVAQNWVNVTGGPAGAPGTIPGFSFTLLTPILKANQEWTATTYVPFYYLILGVVILSMAAFNSLDHSKVGRSWAAIRENEIAADSIGVSGLKYKVMAFAIGASTGGLAGVFLVSQNGTLFPSTFILQVSITVVVCVVFGGMGSIPGVIVGAIIVQGLPNYLQQHSWSFYRPTDLLLYLGALLIVMMIFRPQGLIPARRIRREIELTERGAWGAWGAGLQQPSFSSIAAVDPGAIGSEIQ